MQISTISGCFRLGVILRLGVPQFVILALRVRQQRLVRARLHNLTLIKHRDLIAELAGGEAVADVYRRLIACDFIELFLNLGLGDGIERSGRLIQADKGRVLIQRAGNGNLLRLAARNLHAILPRSLYRQVSSPLGISLANSITPASSAAC